MNAMNPDVTVNTYREFITSENIMDIIKDYDFVIDGTDNFPAKFLINELWLRSHFHMLVLSDLRVSL